MAVDNIEVTLVDRQVDRLAQDTSGMMQPRRKVSELDEVLLVLDGGVAASCIQVVHEWGAKSRAKHRVVATDTNPCWRGFSHAE